VPLYAQVWAAESVVRLNPRRVIPPEQLVDALERIDPRERELLALSLRRRVPDEALARVYDVEPTEVARRRAAAIERLADELGAQRGEDLGAVLKALLDEGTWSAARLSPPDTGNGPVVPEALENEEAVEQAAEPELAAVKTAPAPAPAPEPAVVPVPTEPVLEMLAAREGVKGPDPEVDLRSRRRRRRTPVAAAVAGSFVAAILGGAAAVIGWSEWGDDGGSTSAAESDDGTRHFIPTLGGPLEAPFPSEPQSISCYSTAYVDGPTTLYKQPGGDVRLKLSAKTEWHSDRVFGVVRRRGDWVAVQAPELENNELAWLPARSARLDCVRWSMHADLSKRRLFVRRDGRTVRKFVIAIGRRRNPTPEGRFSVTDKLRVTDRGSPYGCCVLAVSGHQQRLPESWPGGDRLAVHATRELSSIGEPETLGCLRVTEEQARWLIRTMPLGAPLFVRA
jgi:L,D-transpeptidase catalytic domain